ncbi:ArsR/SmtB family transcription factor [Nocardioides sp. AX2bis]|uniref:ArsR/SmtB family transcription factor n=1 Tax=Nocardioides sp. AX2bis TaxID=2653157 RepID=UPI0012F21859|nr:metalloregulator ArsR/SmtB family transcription factor [Nocardioides sp. AX2bis]VXC51472.1 Transcriptional regulator [Nocardioides sp. AX2bis]
MDTAADSCAPSSSAAGEVMARDEAERLAQLIKALGDPTRIQLLEMIRTSPDHAACVCDLTEPLGLSQPTISHHLKVLTDAGLLARERRGAWAWFSVRDDRAEETARLVAHLLGAR